LNIRSPFLWQDNIPLNEFILYTFRATDELPYGDGLARSCFKHVYAMLEGYRIWQKGVERFASGLLDVTTTNNDTNYLNRTKNAFDEIRQASTIVHGKDIELNLVMPSGASGDLWLNFIDHHRASIVRIILGQELTTGQGMGKGSWSLGEVHRGTEKYFLSQPRADLESIITKQLLTRLVMWNYGPDYMDVVPQLFMGFIDHEENGIFAEYMDIFTKLGVTWATEPWIREQANFQPLDSKTLDDPLLAENVVKKIIETHSDKVGQTNKDVSTGESASAE
jgi:phage gp29-like protein